MIRGWFDKLFVTLSFFVRIRWFFCLLVNLLGDDFASNHHLFDFD
ncbi:hypothetical protein PCIT_a2012 [Pseudoalteromonas citrea]|uniref:Uncharacterized protein n=1 Tax=Pseudoalteromonas citrea TaxID=43655 RepID=A0AAD4FS93_9GAMM|nr:hypothetical protein PCIT_a2012 [Pseudoalteromonas citrea]